MKKSKVVFSYNTSMKKNGKKTLTVKELVQRLNITEQTYYNWKKTKPELIKLIDLGIEMEKLINKYQK